MQGLHHAAIRTVAAELANTPAVCRKSYINPVVFAHGDAERCMNPFHLCSRWSAQDGQFGAHFLRLKRSGIASTAPRQEALCGPPWMR